MKLEPLESHKITVQVAPKMITLPINVAMLTALATPVAPDGHPYKYEWTMKDDGNGGSVVMGSTTEKELKLTELTEGTYEFEVTVSNTGPASLATTVVAKVTVFPGKQFQRFRPFPFNGIKVDR